MKKVLQGYISDKLIHFVGRHCKNCEAQYQLLLRILKSGCLSNSEENAKMPIGIAEIEVNGAAKISQNEMYIPQMVCFCDIPFEHLKIHVTKYSRFGLAFEKDFIVKNGGTPVYYMPLKGKASSSISKGQYFDKKLDKFQHYISHLIDIKCLEVRDTMKEIENFLTFHVFSYFKFFDHNLPDDDPSNYYFEREWRVLGNLKFSIKDVTTVFIPINYEARLKHDCPKLKEKGKTLPYK